MRSHFRLIIAVLVSMTFSQAQLFSQALDAFYFRSETNTPWLKRNRGNFTNFQSISSRIIDSSGRFYNKVIELENTYTLNSGDSIKIKRYGDTVFLFQQFDPKSGELIHQGYMKPGETIYGIDSLHLIDVITMEEEWSVDTNFNLSKIGNWYHRLSNREYAIGAYANDKKNGLWHKVYTSAIVTKIKERIEYSDGNLVKSEKIDYSIEMRSNENKWLGKWYLYYRVSELNQSNEEFCMVGVREMTDLPGCQYGGDIEFADAGHLYFRKRFKCASGVGLDKEYRLREWKIEDKNIITFDDFKYKVDYLSDDTMMLVLIED